MSTLPCHGTLAQEVVAALERPGPGRARDVQAHLTALMDHKAISGLRGRRLDTAGIETKLHSSLRHECRHLVVPEGKAQLGNSGDRSFGQAVHSLEGRAWELMALGHFVGELALIAIDNCKSHPALEGEGFDVAKLAGCIGNDDKQPGRFAVVKDVLAVAQPAMKLLGHAHMDGVVEDAQIDAGPVDRGIVLQAAALVPFDEKDRRFIAVIGDREGKPLNAARASICLCRGSCLFGGP